MDIIQQTIRFFCFIILFTISFSCSNTNSPQATPPLTDVVLKLGNVEITKYEFNRKKERTFFKDRGQLYNDWLANYMNDVYLLASAYDKGYDTLSSVTKMVKNTSVQMTTRKNGYLWNATEKQKLDCSANSLMAMYAYRNNTYDIEFFWISDKNTAFTSSREMPAMPSDQQIQKLRSDTSIMHRKGEYTFPFKELHPFKETILSMKKGEKKKIIREDGICVICLKNKLPVQQPPFANEEPLLQNICMQYKSDSILSKRDDEIVKTANIKIINPGFTKLLKALQAFAVNRNRDLKYTRDTVANYVFKGKKEYLTVSGFMDQYINTLFSTAIETATGLEKQINMFVLDKYLFLQADKLGVTQEIFYTLDQKFFKESMMLNTYIQNEFIDIIEIDDEDLHSIYKKEKRNYAVPEHINVSLFKFNREEDALKSYPQIESKIKRVNTEVFLDTLTLPVGVVKDYHRVINTKNSGFSEHIISELNILKTGELMGPVFMDGKYIIIYKEGQNGNRILSFEEVKENLYHRLLNAEVEKEKQARIKSLKDEYEISVLKI